jgi:hypothetical protein
MAKPYVDVWRDKKTGDFLILNFAEDPGWKGVYREIDARIPVAREEMKERGLDLILASLASFEERQSQAPSWLSEEGAEFKKKRRRHVEVTVRKIAPDELELDPSRKEGGGWIGSAPEDRILVRLPCDCHSFFNILSEALDESQ